MSSAAAAAAAQRIIERNNQLLSHLQAAPPGSGKHASAPAPLSAQSSRLSQLQQHKSQSEPLRPAWQVQLVHRLCTAPVRALQLLQARPLISACTSCRPVWASCGTSLLHTLLLERTASNMMTHVVGLVAGSSVDETTLLQLQLLEARVLTWAFHLSQAAAAGEAEEALRSTLATAGVAHAVQAAAAILAAAVVPPHARSVTPAQASQARGSPSPLGLPPLPRGESFSSQLVDAEAGELRRGFKRSRDDEARLRMYSAPVLAASAVHWPLGDGSPTAAAFNARSLSAPVTASQQGRDLTLVPLLGRTDPPSMRAMQALPQIPALHGPPPPQERAAVCSDPCPLDPVQREGIFEELQGSLGQLKSIIESARAEFVDLESMLGAAKKRRV